MQDKIQPYTQKLIDAGIITFNDVDALDSEDYGIATVTYYVNDDYCCLYDEDEFEVTITGIYEKYDIDGDFLQYRLIPNMDLDHDIFVDELEGRLKVYKRITI